MQSHNHRRWQLERLEARALLAVDLAVMVSQATTTAHPGDTVVYHLEYANRGATAATGVAIGEFVFPRAAFNAGASSPGWDCGSNLGPVLASCRYQVGSLPAGGSGTTDFAVTLPNDTALTDYVLWNLVRIGDDGTHGPDVNRRNNRDLATTFVRRPAVIADLAIDISDGGATARPGGSITYTVDYANAGPAAAAAAVIRQTLPAFTTFDAAHSSAGWHCQGDNNVPAANSLAANCFLDVGDLAAGTAGSATLAVTVASTLPATSQELTSTATISTDSAHSVDPAPQNNSDTEATPIEHPPVNAPDLMLAKEADVASAAPGETLTYTLRYANVGPIEATGVVLTEWVPLWTRYIADGSTSGWQCQVANSASAICHLNVGTLAAGQTGSAVLVARLADSVASYYTEIRNSAHIRDDGSHGLDPTPQNNRAIAVTPIRRSPAPSPVGAIEKVTLRATRKS